MRVFLWHVLLRRKPIGTVALMSLFAYTLFAFRHGTVGTVGAP